VLLPQFPRPGALPGLTPQLALQRLDSDLRNPQRPAGPFVFVSLCERTDRHTEIGQALVQPVGNGGLDRVALDGPHTRVQLRAVALTCYFSSVELRGFELLTPSMPWSFVLRADVSRCVRV
jgi:hypothetical protein